MEKLNITTICKFITSENQISDEKKYEQLNGLSFTCRNYKLKIDGKYIYIANFFTS